MMTRKKRKAIIIASIAIILIIIASVIAFLYFTTDMLKTNKQLFAKYIGKNFENAESLIESLNNNDYKNTLSENKYTTSSQIKINYTQDIGTSLENTDNVINKLKILVEGQTDKTNNYSYKNVKLLNDNEEQLEVELVKQENTYGIRFSDLFKKYLLVDNSNLKDLFEKMGYTDTQLQEIPDEIQLNVEKGEIKFSDEEKKTLQEKYINILNEEISQEKFSKESKQIVTINNKQIVANVYTLTLKKEELNNLYIKILENLKEDEVILAKIDAIGSMLNKNEENSLRNQFIEEIENLIAKINSSNIGQDETKIIVSESKGNTVSTEIKTNEYEIKIECLKEDEEKYLKISNNDMNASQEKVDTIELHINKEKTDWVLTKKNGDEENVLTINNTFKETNTNKFTNNLTAKYEYNQAKLELNVTNDIEIVNEFEDIVELNDENSLKLNDMTSEQLNNILDQVNTGVSEKINKISQNIDTQDLIFILNDIGLVKDTTIIEENIVSETEKNRFNLQFEMLQGENLDSSKMLTLIEAIKNNFVNIEVVSNKQIKLELDRYNKDEKMAQTLTNFVENNKDKKYNATIEYDEQTGLVKYIVLTIVEKQ